MTGCSIANDVNGHEFERAAASDLDRHCLRCGMSKMKYAETGWTCLATPGVPTTGFAEVQAAGWVPDPNPTLDIEGIAGVTLARNDAVELFVPNTQNRFAG